MADTTEAESWTSHIAPFSSLFEDHFMWTFPPSISIFSSWLCMIWIVPKVSLAKNATSFAQVHLAYWSTWKHTIIKKRMADLNVSSVDAFLSMPVAWLLTKKLMRWAPSSARSAPEHCPMQWRSKTTSASTPCLQVPKLKRRTMTMLMKKGIII